MIHRYYLRLMQAGRIISLACQYISSAPLNPHSSLEIYSHCPEPLGNRELKFFSFTVPASQQRLHLIPRQLIACRLWRVFIRETVYFGCLGNSIPSSSPPPPLQRRRTPSSLATRARVIL